MSTGDDDAAARRPADALAAGPRPGGAPRTGNGATAWRAWTLMGGVAMSALLAWAPPSRADITDGEVEEAVSDAIEETLEPLFENIIEILLVVIEEQADLPTEAAAAQIEKLQQILGRARRSYLKVKGAAEAIEELFPEDPDIFAPDDGSAYVLERDEDRKERVTEAMDLAATIREQSGVSGLTIEALQALNRSPAGVVGGIQIGNEAVLQVAQTVERLTQLTAELGQLEADQRVMEDWNRVALDRWKREHAPEGFWTGRRTWRPDVIRMDY